MAKLKGKAKAAFLRRMAKGRNKHTTTKRKRKHTKQGVHHVAKKRHHKGKRSGSRKSRRTHVGGLGRFLPPTDTLVGIGTAFAYGKVEGAAKTDDKHFLRSVPALVPQIGRAGNAGALLWLAGVVTKHRMVQNVAKGVLHVAAYQNAATPGGFTKDQQDFKLSGPGRRGRDEQLVESYLRRHANDE